MPVVKPLRLSLKTTNPVWVQQWPLTREKLSALHSLLDEQIMKGHVESSLSPYNTPVFVIKKKSGKWCLLHDLHAINAIINPMGPLQCGLPNPNLIPRDYDLLVIDLKDCFFSIPLHPQVRHLFAFTVPELNNAKPTTRYQWKVLPQGMVNSPTMCQYHVDKILQPFRDLHPLFLIYHYMDDILVVAPGPRGTVIKILPQLTTILTRGGLFVAPDKIQSFPPYQYLGHKLLASYAAPSLPALNLSPQPTLIQLQQYLGAINWARPYMALTTAQLSPLSSALSQGSHPADSITLNDAQNQFLQLVNAALQSRWVDRMTRDVPLDLLIANTPQLPTGAIVQLIDSKLLILEWLHLSHTPRATITTKPMQLATLISRARNRTKHHVPCSLSTWETLFAASDDLQYALADWVGSVSCHPPSDPRLHLAKAVRLTWTPVCTSSLLPTAITVFADGSKTFGACAWQDQQGQWRSATTSPHPSAQRAELAASLLSFQLFSMVPFNLILDSLYVIQIVKSIYQSYLSPLIDTDLLSLLLPLQQAITARTHPFHVSHKCSHQPFPGFLQEGNDIADAAASAMSSPSALVLSPLSPWESHSCFHQNKKALIKQFGISNIEAVAIIQQCPTCSKQALSLPMGVNPRGTSCCEIWQMDVTQYPPFAPWKYLHVSIDIYSGFIMASPQRGEATKQVINHCIRSFAALGRPQQLKTDNGPAYTSAAFAAFCNKWDIVHKFGIPYNSQGQALVERTNQTLKHSLNRYLGTRGNAPWSPGTAKRFKYLFIHA
uniref:Uncharacterized protein n=1 Tax=Naja naja TaxID=35670 RepID=A0A8C7E1Z3_NAJNA